MNILYFKIALLLLFSLRQIKNFLFWTYLWQLKNYHIGRFLAHFSTYKGKKLIYNPLLKTILLIGLFLNSTISLFLLILIYLIEFSDLFRKKIILPQKTSKTLFLSFLILFSFSLFLIFIFNFDLLTLTISIILFDILTPLIVSLIILLFQPITVILRNRIINKAIKKRKSLENLLVIGITGSYGKSSTKEFLKTILSKEFDVIATEKNENSEMGISRCILNNLKEENEIFICEMGAYNRGGIKLLSKIALPKIGILTGINNQHLATFGSQENIIKTKFELIDSLPLEGLAVLNWDNQHIKDNFKSDISSIKYSAIEESDIYATEIMEDEEGISFKINSKKGESYSLKTKIKGIQNVSNLLACVSVAKKLGMTFEEIGERIGTINNSKIKKVKNFDIIESTYSSNFNGIMAHLEEIKKWKGDKIIVMPCLIELGSEAKNTHYEIGRKIGEICDLAIITSKDYEKELKKGFNFSKKDNTLLFMENGIEIYKEVFSRSKNDSVILLESRVPNSLIKKINE